MDWSPLSSFRLFIMPENEKVEQKLGVCACWMENIDSKEKSHIRERNIHFITEMVKIKRGKGWGEGNKRIA